MEAKNTQIEETIGKARTLLCTLLHNFQSKGSEVLPSRNVAELLALTDDNLIELEALTSRKNANAQVPQFDEKKAATLDREDALTAYTTRTDAIAETLANNFLQGTVGYHSINEETVASLLWQVQANMNIMTDLAKVRP